MIYQKYWLEVNLAVAFVILASTLNTTLEFIVFIFVFSKGIEVLTKTNSYKIPYDGPSKSVFEKWLPFSKVK